MKHSPSMHSTKQDNNKFLIALIKAVTVLLTYFNCATLSNTQIQLQQSFIAMHNNYIKCFVDEREKEIESNNTVTQRKRIWRELTLANMKTIFQHFQNKDRYAHRMKLCKHRMCTMNMYSATAANIFCRFFFSLFQQFE